MADKAYLREGIRRIESGEVQAGSHAAGIFGRCATEFEGAIRVLFMQLLPSCGLEYEQHIRSHCKGVLADKTTLGNLIAGIERVAVLKPGSIERGIPSANDTISFLKSLREINEDWVRMKHHEEVEIPIILDRMKSMARVLGIEAVEPHSTGDA